VGAVWHCPAHFDLQSWRLYESQLVQRIHSRSGEDDMQVYEDSASSREDLLLRVGSSVPL